LNFTFRIYTFNFTYRFLDSMIQLCEVFSSTSCLREGYHICSINKLFSLSMFDFGGILFYVQSHATWSLDILSCLYFFKSSKCLRDIHTYIIHLCLPIWEAYYACIPSFTWYIIIYRVIDSTLTIFVNVTKLDWHRVVSCQLTISSMCIETTF